MSHREPSFKGAAYDDAVADRTATQRYMSDHFAHGFLQLLLKTTVYLDGTQVANCWVKEIGRFEEISLVHAECLVELRSGRRVRVVVYEEPWAATP